MPGPPDGTIVRVINKASKTALDISDYDGKTLNSWEANTLDNQKWIITSAPNGYRVLQNVKRATGNGYLAAGPLEANGRATATPGVVTAWDLQPVGSFDYEYIIRLPDVSKNLVLEVPGGSSANAGPINLNTANGSASQTWEVRPVGPSA